ncbi:MAG: hypothetical protein ACRDI2_03500 [Chloroflexota bacterium]
MPSESTEPDVRRYAQELQAMLRQRSPQAYRAFLREWRDLHQRGVADRLATMDDAALRLRLERMILDMPALADLHESARAYLREHGAAVPAEPAGTPALDPSADNRSPPGVAPSQKGGRPRRALPTRGTRLRRRPRG